MTTAQELHKIADEFNAEHNALQREADKVLCRVRSFAACAAEQGKYSMFMPYDSIFEDVSSKTFAQLLNLVNARATLEGFEVSFAYNQQGHGLHFAW